MWSDIIYTVIMVGVGAGGIIIASLIPVIVAFLKRTHMKSTGYKIKRHGPLVLKV